MIKGFKFSVREFAGSLGDFGTLLHFTVDYIVMCGFNSTGLLLGIGFELGKISLKIQGRNEI